MQQCRFCGKWFKNKQAVRAHLKHCSEYLMTKGEKDILRPVRIPVGRRISMKPGMKKCKIPFDKRTKRI